MIVRNWMKTEPTTVGEDTLVSEVKRLLTEKNLRAVPVITGEGRLRGLITRAACLRAAEFVTRSQDPYELKFFAGRLKAKDIMVRNPVTVDACDTMEHTLLMGQENGISQFPVVDDGKLVGMVSASEIFHLAARVLGAWETWSGVTLGTVSVGKGTLGAVAEAVEGAGAVLESVFSVCAGGGDEAAANANGAMPRKVIVRFRGAPMDAVTAALERGGFQILEACEVQQCRNGRAA